MKTNGCGGGPEGKEKKKTLAKEETVPLIVTKKGKTGRMEWRRKRKERLRRKKRCSHRRKSSPNGQGRTEGEKGRTIQARVETERSNCAGVKSRDRRGRRERDAVKFFDQRHHDEKAGAKKGIGGRPEVTKREDREIRGGGLNRP